MDEIKSINNNISKNNLNTSTVEYTDVILKEKVYGEKFKMNEIEGFEKIKPKSMKHSFFSSFRIARIPSVTVNKMLSNVKTYLKINSGQGVFVNSLIDNIQNNINFIKIFKTYTSMSLANFIIPYICIVKILEFEINFKNKSKFDLNINIVSNNAASVDFVENKGKLDLYFDITTNSASLIKYPNSKHYLSSNIYFDKYMWSDINLNKQIGNISNNINILPNRPSETGLKLVSNFSVKNNLNKIRMQEYRYKQMQELRVKKMEDLRIEGVEDGLYILAIREYYISPLAGNDVIKIISNYNYNWTSGFNIKSQQCSLINPYYLKNNISISELNIFKNQSNIIKGSNFKSNFKTKLNIGRVIG